MIRKMKPIISRTNIGFVKHKYSMIKMMIKSYLSAPTVKKKKKYHDENKIYPIGVYTSVIAWGL